MWRVVDRSVTPGVCFASSQMQARAVRDRGSEVYPSATWPQLVETRGFRVLFRTSATGVCEGLGVVQHKTQIVAYVRVSSTDQNLDRQLETIGDVDRVF